MTKFQSVKQFQHDAPQKIGVLLTNLGTPDAPTPHAVRRYLAEFLSDPRIVEISKPLWRLILHGIVLRIRPRTSAKLYKKIWQPQGSPLLVNAIQQAKALQTSLSQNMTKSIVVVLGMRYGQPSIAKAIDQLYEANVSKLIILPLFPQYCAATTASTFDAVSKVLNKKRRLPELRMINGYADHPDYINALAKSIEEHWHKNTRSEKLLMSFHGIPQRNFEKGDPYYCYCHKTARLVAEKLQLTEDQWMMVFQSRFGKQEWLKPYCVDTLISLPQNNVKSVDVVCPGFSADCLETLEEIAITNKKLFHEAGGETYNYIPALNAQADHINLLTSLIREHSQPWV